MKDVVSESMGGKSIERQLIEINNSSEKVFSGLEAKVKKIESQQMSPENTKKAEDMSAVLYELVRDKRQQISAAYNIAITTLKENMKKAITEVSQKKNIKLVIDSGFIIYHAPDCWDITKDVIAVMDGMCPEIVVKLKKKKFTNTKKLKDFSELNELADVID
jgi:Skp family chaperone for outer membrane proteins